MSEVGPSADQIEVSVFSRGYGEAIAVHVGSGRWLLIDTLKSASGNPAALEYLKQIGVPFEAVEAFLITHWHDDHVAGAAQIVEECTNAKIILSGAIRQDEFRAFLGAHSIASAGSFGTGVQELSDVLRFCKANKRQVKWAWAERVIAEEHSPSGYRLDALSPSDKDFEDLLLDVAEWGNNSGRMPRPKRNDASVAAALKTGDDLLLFGADLEVKGSDRGWAAVHSQVWNSRGKADFFKVAHHGSITGEHGPVWADMLVKDAVAVLTPWNRGRKLPTPEDVDRILAYTADAHSAAKIRPANAARRSNTVERSLREANIKITKTQSDTGHVRFRKVAGAAWSTEYVSGGSCHLSDLLKT